ncbi:unnamed protein product [Blepharisma stoltei]|uniref:Uncharacterized protein n=1 Tax=Blepharisma stoltei TaxID=1481888 RepID=A0AAU9I9F1_9CILI|nr:unnamed protein product [Blepharisma stoltei]
MSTLQLLKQKNNSKTSAAKDQWGPPRSRSSSSQALKTNRIRYALQDETKSSIESQNSLKALKLPPLPVAEISSKPSFISEDDPSKLASTSESDLENIKNSLESEWSTRNIPEDLRIPYRESIFQLPRHKAHLIISKEIYDLSKSKALIQIAIRAVIAREESLKNIHEMDEFLQNSGNWESITDVQLETAELLHGHRMLTLSAVESIIRWRESLYAASLINQVEKPKKIPFIWNGENYIKKMKADMDFLKSSSYSKVFNFEDGADPLLVRPSKIEKKEKVNKRNTNYFIDQGQVFVPLPSSLQKRVQAAEEAIFGEDIEKIPEESPSIYMSRTSSSSDLSDKLSNSPQMTHSKVLKTIVEEIIEEEIDEKLEDTVREAKQEEEIKNQKINLTKMIFDDILNEVIEKECPIIAENEIKNKKDVNEKLKGYYVSSFIEDEIIKNLREIAKAEIEAAKKKQKENKLVSEDVFEKLLIILIREVVELEVDREKKMANNTKLAKNIVGSLVDECVERLLKEFADTAINDAKKVFEKDLNDMNSKIALIIANQLIDEIVLNNEDFGINSISESALQEMKQNHKEKIEQFNSNLALLIYNEIVDSLINGNSDLNMHKIAEIALKSTEKESAKMIEDISLIIYNELFDYLIYQYSEFNLSNIAEMTVDEIKKKIKETKDKELQGLANVIYGSLLDEHIADTNLNRLSNKEIRLEEQRARDLKARSEVIEELGLDFAYQEDFQDLSNVEFRPIGVPEIMIISVLDEYYRFIPEICKPSLPTIMQLLNEITRGINPCWYWALKENRILGLIVYTQDCIGQLESNLIIHHFSCLNWEAYPGLLEATKKFLFSNDKFDEIRVNLIAGEIQEVPLDVKRIFSKGKFKWKANSETEDKYDIAIMGITRANTNIILTPRKTQNQTIRVVSGCCIEIDNETNGLNLEIGEESMQIGNRQCLINSILGLMGQLVKNQIKVSQLGLSNLHNDISNILEYASSSESFNFPYMSSIIATNKIEASEFIQKNKMMLPTPRGKSSISCLDISFRWPSCTFIHQKVFENDYHFMRFKSNKLSCARVNDFMIFKVPTEFSNLFTFFITTNDDLKQDLASEIYKRKNDIFYKANSILKQVVNFEPIEELRLPCFNKDLYHKLSWVKGYEILPQKDETGIQKIASCNECVKLEMRNYSQFEGILRINPHTGYIIDQDFIFGIMHKKVDMVLDIPLFVCLIEKCNWIAC